MQSPSQVAQDGFLDGGSGRRDQASCVYTALINGYETLNEQPVARSSSVDFICFTDDPDLRSETWDVRLVEPVLPGDPARSQRFIKICAHRWVPQYDVSLYMDNSVILRRSPEEMIDELLPPHSGIAVLRHSFRATVRDEFDEVAALRLDAACTCAEQLAHYEAVDPGSVLLPPLWSGMLVRRHNDPAVIAAMERWFAHVLRYSRRDQLSVWYALRAEGVQPDVHVLDNFESHFHQWPVAHGRDRSRGGTPQALELERQLRQLDDDCRRLDEERTRLAHELDAIRMTRSWRWTSPLRHIRRRLTTRAAPPPNEEPVAAGASP